MALGPSSELVLTLPKPQLPLSSQPPPDGSSANTTWAGAGAAAATGVDPGIANGVATIAAAAAPAHNKDFRDFTFDAIPLFYPHVAVIKHR